ncbi:MAG: glycosyltransferase family 2 protein [Bacteroidia bacterium]|nr:glycosyltransferase family 2 protein [Bacteroidia bacterium]MCZ2276403.1 glycosyltransferase family 2 protein [Bacteroidia bacterium]
MTAISVVIPIYNESGNIQSLYERLTSVIKRITADYELLFVNDGSRDDSLQLIKELAGKDSAVGYIDFSRNFGHQIAVTAGLDHCKGDAVVIIDADLQDPPELIAALYQKMNEGFEVVYARRKDRKGESWMKRTTAKYFYRILASITSINIPLDTGDFRIMHRNIVNILKQMPEQQKFLRGQISWVGFNQTFIEYDRDVRNSGETGYTYKKMIRFALDGITSFSTLPLKFASALGFFVSVAAFIISLYVLYSKFILSNVVPGWASLMLVVLFLGGVQLICIGIIGEYISRISANVRNRPLYVIKEIRV